MKRDADGHLLFCFAQEGIIRRRGENIAGAELDRVIGEHPDVKAGGGCRGARRTGEDEILAAVVIKAGRLLEAKDVAAWCAERLAPQKVPRYVAFLKRTALHVDEQIQKAALRADSTLRSARGRLIARILKTGSKRKKTRVSQRLKRKPTKRSPKFSSARVSRLASHFTATAICCGAPIGRRL